MTLRTRPLEKGGPVGPAEGQMGRVLVHTGVEWYLAHKKPRPLRTLQSDYA